MRPPRGREILLVAAILNAGLVAAALLLEGASEEGIRFVIRHTAKLAVVLLAGAFTASSLQTLRPTAFSRYLLANRRMLGLAMALSHTLHLAALVMLGMAYPDPFVAELDAVTLIGGGGAYAFMFAMAATSWDGAVKRLGRERWRQLHTLGGWYLWVVFTQSYLGRAVVEPLHVASLFSALLLAVGALRAVRWRSHRRRVAPAA